MQPKHGLHHAKAIQTRIEKFVELPPGGPAGGWVGGRASEQRTGELVSEGGLPGRQSTCRRTDGSTDLPTDRPTDRPTVHAHAPLQVFFAFGCVHVLHACRRPDVP